MRRAPHAPYILPPSRHTRADTRFKRRGARASCRAQLPYIKVAINVLRSHYPGRLGCACFINTPGYFYPVWKIIGPWLDEEIIHKTFFLPKSVTDVELAVQWVDKKRLPDPAADP